MLSKVPILKRISIKKKLIKVKSCLTEGAQN